VIGQREGERERREREEKATQRRGEKKLQKTGTQQWEPHVFRYEKKITMFVLIICYYLQFVFIGIGS